MAAPSNFIISLNELKISHEQYLDLSQRQHLIQKIWVRLVVLVKILNTVREHFQTTLTSNAAKFQQHARHTIFFDGG
jgi:hypothetical protein